MTPPAATAAARSHTRRPARTVAPRTARRVSGPAHAPGRTATAGAGVVAAPLGARLVHRAVRLPDARVLDRLLRGRLWIALLAVGLVGIVFLQISLLKLNTGISRAVETSQTLERQNMALKMELSALGGGERVQESAAARGFVTPATGQPRFLDASRPSATRAAANITPPAPIEQLPLGMIPPAQGGTAGITPDPAPTATATAPAPTPAPVVTAPAPAAVAPQTAAPAAATATAGGLAAVPQG